MSRFVRKSDEGSEPAPDRRLSPVRQRHAASYDPNTDTRTWNGQPWPKGTPRPGPSAYGDPARLAPSKVVTVMTVTGKFLGMEVDGEFQPAKPCCPDAMKCRRPECWKPLEEFRR
jgi:hypothetical protein